MFLEINCLKQFSQEQVGRFVSSPACLALTALVLAILLHTSSAPSGLAYSFYAVAGLAVLYIAYKKLSPEQQKAIEPFPKPNMYVATAAPTVSVKNLSFGLSSSESRNFTEENRVFFAKAIVEDAIAEQKSRDSTSKSLEYEGVKPKTQVKRDYLIQRMSEPNLVRLSKEEALKRAQSCLVEHGSHFVYLAEDDQPHIVVLKQNKCSECIVDEIISDMLRHPQIENHVLDPTKRV